MALYNCMGGTSTTVPAYKIGTVGNGGTINIKNRYDDYANLTASNFLAVPQNNNVSATNTGGYTVYWSDDWSQYVEDTNTVSYSKPTVSYDATNGVVTITNSSLSVGGTAKNRGTDIQLATVTTSGSVGLTVDVYLLPEIENL